MTMKNPPHPGRIVRQECIEPLGITVKDAAERLGIQRQTLNNLVNGKGSSPEVWLGMQMEYDLAQARKNAGRIANLNKVQRITMAAARSSSRSPRA